MIKDPETIYDLKIGMVVVDIQNSRRGRIHSIQMPKAEWLEAMVLWDKTDKPEVLKWNKSFIRVYAEDHV